MGSHPPPISIRAGRGIRQRARSAPCFLSPALLLGSLLGYIVALLPCPPKTEASTHVGSYVRAAGIEPYCVLSLRVEIVQRCELQVCVCGLADTSSRLVAHARRRETARLYSTCVTRSSAYRIVSYPWTLNCVPPSCRKCGRSEKGGRGVISKKLDPTRIRRGSKSWLLLAARAHR